MTARTTTWMPLLLCGILLGWASAASAQDYSAIPTDGRDAAERLIFKFEGRYDTTSNELSGTDAPQPFDASGLRTNTNFGLADLRLGTRGVFLPTLNTYAILSSGFDLDGQPTIAASETGAAPDSTEHRYIQNAYGDNAVFLQLAYAELEGFSDKGFLSKVSLRAGRQFHWGATPITFDGATLNFDNGSLNVGVRGGVRSGVYNQIQDDNGFVGGVDVAYDFAATGSLPLLVKGEYTFMSREITVIGRDRVAFALGKESDEDEDVKVDLSTGVGQLSGYLDINNDTMVFAKLRLTETDLSRAHLGLRLGFGESALLLDLRQKIGEDLFFDLAGGKGLTVTDPATGFERRTTYEVFRLNSPDLQAFTDLQAQVPLVLTDWLTVNPQAGVHYVLGDAETLSAYDATSFNWGLGVHLRTRVSDKAGLEFDLEYAGRAYDRSNTAGDSLGLFSGVESGPETGSNEVYAGVSYNRGQRFVSGRMLGNRSLTIGAGFFHKIYTLEGRRLAFDSPDFSVTETLSGASARADWRFTDYTSAGLQYEFARDSNVFYSHLSNFHNVRASLKLQF